MCGIAGIFGQRDQQKAIEFVRTMNGRIAHRGPDAEGLWSDADCTLGHRRLSIIDTSDAGNQPFFSADKRITVIFNGEIYNYIELKKVLASSYHFKTATDTEVIIAAYLKWGKAFVHHFIGMFALALKDSETGELLIVRDRLGVKPVYWSKTSEGYLFASEIRAMLATGLVNKKISASSLADYLRYQTVHAPHTIIEEVKMLEAGHMIIYSGGECRIEKYWSPSDNINSSAASDNKEQVKKKVLDLLTSSIEVRMRADVPFGAFLSGGIDSSVIVGLMSRSSLHPVKTFSITFHEKEFDESPYSEVIARKFKTDHTPIRLRANDFLEMMPEALKAMDHPSGDGPNTYVVSKVTREAGVKMALSGLGGDEVFAGYDVFRRMKDLENKVWMNRIPSSLRHMAGLALKKARPSVSSEKIAEGIGSPRVDFAHFYPIVRQVLLDDQVYKLLRSNGDQTNFVFELARQIQTLPIETLSKVSIAEMQTYMQNVLLRDTDQMSMAHALEVRVPFLDHRLVEYVLGVGDEIKYPHTPKELLTSAVGDLLPHEVIHRPKMGFTFPWAVWMRNELRSFCYENLLSLKQVEAIHHEEVMHMWQRFLAGDHLITWSRIWPLVVLGHWVKQHEVY
jgi:asparagine synthase (glutamine-hydrolysing)